MEQIATTPAWLPLVISVVLLLVLVFLYWSMRRNLKRIDFDDGTETPAADPPPPKDEPQR